MGQHIRRQWRNMAPSYEKPRSTKRKRRRRRRECAKAVRQHLTSMARHNHNNKTTSIRPPLPLLTPPVSLYIYDYVLRRPYYMVTHIMRIDESLAFILTLVYIKKKSACGSHGVRVGLRHRWTLLNPRFGAHFQKRQYKMQKWPNEWFHKINRVNNK